MWGVSICNSILNIDIFRKMATNTVRVKIQSNGTILYKDATINNTTLIILMKSHAFINRYNCICLSIDIDMKFYILIYLQRVYFLEHIL